MYIGATAATRKKRVGGTRAVYLKYVCCLFYQIQQTQKCYSYKYFPIVRGILGIIFVVALSLSRRMWTLRLGFLHLDFAPRKPKWIFVRVRRPLIRSCHNDRWVQRWEQSGCGLSYDEECNCPFSLQA